MLYYVVNTKLLFKNLNDYKFPKIKVLEHNKNLDICEEFIKVLFKGNFLNSNFIDYADLHKWLTCYYESDEGLEKVINLAKMISRDE